MTTVEAPPKERPILFSAPMVRAILDGRKTQTRRIVKPQIVGPLDQGAQADAGYVLDLGRPHKYGRSTMVRCPYGQPGERLWVRETHAFVTCESTDPGAFLGETRDIYSDYGHWFRVAYAADPGPITWDPPNFRPSIHMPRWACRIVLEVVSVRLERLKEIDGLDAIQEGLADLGIPERRWHWDPAAQEGFFAPWRAFRALWETVNGAGAWEANPWVWVVEFRRVEPAAK